MKTVKSGPVTFTKVGNGSYYRVRLAETGQNLGAVWNNGAGRSYLPTWSAQAPGRPEVKHSTRDAAAKYLVAVHNTGA